MLPDYLAKAVPNPMGKRAPWYANTAPTYAGIFLWIAFYQQMAGGTLQHGGLGLCLVALAVAGILSYALYYRVPAMLGMKTGFPLYVVGSSTFGTAGGYVMPGLLMGLLQIGWFAVATFFSADYILRGMGMASKPGTLPFGIACVLWGGAMAFVGAKGVQYVSKIALFLNAIPLLMLLVVFFQTSGGIGKYQVAAAQQNSFGAFTTMIAIVIGFFATAGAAGADFGMNARDERDVRWGGLVGITLAALVAGGLPLMGFRRSGAGHRRAHRVGHAVPVRHRVHSGFVLLRIHRGEQLQHHDPERAARVQHDGRRGGGSAAGDHGRGRQPDRVLHHRRSQLRTHHRRHGGRLSAGREEVERPARRRESGGLYRLGGGLHRGHSAARCAADYSLARNEELRAAGGGVQLHRRLRGLLRAGQGGPAAEVGRDAEGGVRGEGGMPSPRFETDFCGGTRRCVSPRQNRIPFLS